MINHRILLLRQYIFIILKRVNRQIIIIPGAGQQIAEKLGRVKKQIGPVAFRSGRGIGGMWNVPGDTGHIPCLKRKCLSVKCKNTTVAVTDSNLETIMKMKPAAGNIRDFPVISGQQQNREVKRQVIITVFHDSAFLLWHRSYLLVENVG